VRVADLVLKPHRCLLLDRDGRGGNQLVIERAIEELPPSQRAVISLRDVEGWSAEEVRNALEVSESNQRVLLHRARAKVRKAIEEYVEEP
jgi:RNA polymerase sigma-70 factor (ECF subfamily)